MKEYTGVTIVSEKVKISVKPLLKKLDRGVTVYKGKGGHGKRGGHQQELGIIFTLVTRLEIGKLKTIIKNLDVNAFMVQHSINDMLGGMIKKRPLH